MAKVPNKQNAGKYESELKVCRETLESLASLSSLLIIADRLDLDDKCDKAYELIKEIRAKLKGLQ